MRTDPAPTKPAPPGGADLARLRLYQLISPVLPVGAFSYSEGLEVLVQSGRLNDAAAVQGWLRAELERGGLRLEAASLPQLMELLRRWREETDGGDANRSIPGRRDPCAADPELSDSPGTGDAGTTPPPQRKLLELNSWLLAQREAAELRAQQRQMGGSLLQLLADLGWPLPQPLPQRPLQASPTDLSRPTVVAWPTVFAWPTAFAWAGVCLELHTGELVEAYLYGWVANQLSAAVRLVPLGPTEAQRLQLQLAPVIAAQASLLATSDPRDLWNGGVGAGLAQLGHGELYSRLFRS